MTTTHLPPRIQELLANNKKFSETWPAQRKFSEMRAYGKAVRNIPLVLTCMDGRIVPANFLGPELRAPVVRNAGGRVTEDVIRSIIVIRQLMDIKSVMVIHHTDCGATQSSDAEVIEDAKARVPEAAERLDKLEPLCIDEEKYIDALKEDVLLLRNEKALADLSIHGFDMDIDTALLRYVEV